MRSSPTDPGGRAAAPGPRVAALGAPTAAPGPRAVASARAAAAILLAAASALVSAAILFSAAPLAAQSPADRLKEAREAQQEFELYRQSRIPVERPDSAARCDEQIGRICIWFGGEGEADFPPEPPETDQARRGLIGVLLQTREAGALDFWLLGQLVHYLVEQGDPRMAERMATECGIPETWWCSALLGYSRHVRGAFVESEDAFREAVDAMPPGERRRWTIPYFVVEPDAVKAFEALGPAELEREWERFWRLSDPLFLVPGNDRLTDHWARLVQVTNFRNAQHPQNLEWDEDLEATLVRYGRIVGWSRTHDPRFSPGVRMRLEDTRRVVGHHHPNSRGYVFPSEFVESPSDIPPESWITAPREARTWYAPPYAPDFEGLETQVGRFRRGDAMLVVGAYRPDPGLDPFGRVEGAVDAALFLVPEDGGDALQVPGRDPSGVLTMLAPPGRYVGSLEVHQGRRAWRARQGVKQEPLVEGLVDVSDLLVLARGAPFPGSLDEAIPHVRPGVRVRAGERITLVWEAYGLRVAEPVRVTVGFTRGRPGFLARVGEFLGILEPDTPVEVTFTDEGPGGVQTAFRAMEMELPDVEPGAYTLHVRLELPGRNPVVTSRPIVVQ